MFCGFISGTCIYMHMVLCIAMVVLTLSAGTSFTSFDNFLFSYFMS